MIEYKLQKAFTLIELLVVIGIMSVLFSIGVYTYINFQRPQQLENAVTKVATDLKYAQNKSFAGTKDASVCVAPSKDMLGWIVRFEQNGTNYVISGACGTISSPVAFAPSTISLPNGVSISEINGTSGPWANIFVLFKPVEGAVEFYDDDDLLTPPLPTQVTPNPLSITLHSDSGNHKVCITSNGRIYETRGNCTT